MSVKSSYLNSLSDFSSLFKLTIFQTKPKKIVEFGILDGFSLECMAQSAPPHTQIYAYDIFENFNGNSASYDDIVDKFKKYPNVVVEYGDFYEKHKSLHDIDILHIDIANTGDIYKFAVDNYLDKLSENGVMILEGGSTERDNVEWMRKYDKTSICEYLQELPSNVRWITVPDFPSITFISR